MPHDNLKEFLVFAAELKIFGLMEEVIRGEADDFDLVSVQTKLKNTDEVEEDVTDCEEDFDTILVDEIPEFFVDDVTKRTDRKIIDEETLAREDTTESLEEQIIVDYNRKVETKHVTERTYSTPVTLNILEKLLGVMIDQKLPMSQIRYNSFLPKTTNKDQRHYIRKSIEGMLEKCKANMKQSPKFLNSADAEEKIRCLLLILQADQDFRANVRVKHYNSKMMKLM